MADPKEIRLSHSALHALSECGERYRLRYVEGKRLGSSYRMIVGTAVHKAGAEAHTRVKRARDAGASIVEAVMEIPSQEEMEGLAESAFLHEETEGGVVLSEDERATGRLLVRERQRWRARRAANVYRTQIAPRVDPIAIERKFEVRPKGMNIALTGVVDLAHQDPLSGKVIVDTKVTGRRPAHDAADKSLQLTMYYTFEAIATGVPPSRVALNYVVQPDGDQPGSVVPLVTTRNADNVRALIERIGAAEKSIRAGVFVPANADHWTCSEKFCEFWQVCKFAHRR